MNMSSMRRVCIGGDMPLMSPSGVSGGTVSGMIHPESCVSRMPAIFSIASAVAGMACLRDQNRPGIAPSDVALVHGAAFAISAASSTPIISVVAGMARAPVGGSMPRVLAGSALTMTFMPRDSLTTAAGMAGMSGTLSGGSMPLVLARGTFAVTFMTRGISAPAATAPSTVAGMACAPAGGDVALMAAGGAFAVTRMVSAAASDVAGMASPHGNGRRAWIKIPRHEALLDTLA